MADNYSGSGKNPSGTRKGQMESPHFGSPEDCTKSTLKPTVKGTNSGLSGDNLPGRTKSPNAQDEKIFEPAKGGNLSRP